MVFFCSWGRNHSVQRRKNHIANSQWLRRLNDVGREASPQFIPISMIDSHRCPVAVKHRIDPERKSHDELK